MNLLENRLDCLVSTADIISATGRKDFVLVEKTPLMEQFCGEGLLFRGRFVFLLLLTLDFEQFFVGRFGSTGCWFVGRCSF